MIQRHRVKAMSKHTLHTPESMPKVAWANAQIGQFENAPQHHNMPQDPTSPHDTALGIYPSIILLKTLIIVQTYKSPYIELELFHPIVIHGCSWDFYSAFAWSTACHALHQNQNTVTNCRTHDQNWNQPNHLTGNRHSQNQKNFFVTPLKLIL